MEDIEYYDIPVYNFPYDVEEDDEETIQDNSELRVRPHARFSIKCRTLISAFIGHDAVCYHWLGGRSRD